MKKVFIFFDKLEDRIRGSLSHYPVIYGVIAGFSMVFFWHGVTLIAESIPLFSGDIYGGIVSTILSSLVLLFTGLFVSFFIGDSIIISGLKKEKKLIEKSEEEFNKEILEETALDRQIKNRLLNSKQIEEEIKRELIEKGSLNIQLKDRLSNIEKTLAEIKDKIK